MKPVRILVAIFAVVALVPLCLVRAGDQTEAALGSARSEPVRPTSALSIDRNSLVALPEHAGAPENPPSESEVWAKVALPSSDHARFYKVERNNIRIVIEKIADKTDPLKVYPLAGPCHLVHRHYKCTVYFDEVFRADYPISFDHVDHKVEVVYIDKDFLRAAVAPGPPADKARDPNATDGPPAKSRDDRIDRIVREIEQLKRDLQSDRQDQERVLDRLIKELESLKKLTRRVQSAPR